MWCISHNSRHYQHLYHSEKPVQKKGNSSMAQSKASYIEKNGTEESGRRRRVSISKKAGQRNDGQMYSNSGRVMRNAGRISYAGMD
jgi:hypothetical protein